MKVKAVLDGLQIEFPMALEGSADLIKDAIEKAKKESVSLINCR